MSKLYNKQEVKDILLSYISNTITLDSDTIIDEYDARKDGEEAKRIKSLFITYFDGCYRIDPQPNVPNTSNMGVCKLDYIRANTTLIVHLRRPGLLIGKGGRTLDSLKKYLNCTIDIIEVNLLK